MGYEKAWRAAERGWVLGVCAREFEGGFEVLGMCVREFEAGVEV